MNKLFAYGRAKQAKSKKIIITVFVIILLATLAFIWGNSLKDRTQSANQSDKVIEIIKPDIVETKGEEYLSFSQIIRKAGHFLEFCLLGFELSLFMLFMKKLSFQNIFNASALTLLVAVIDESLQMLNNRVADVKDVLTDFCGGITGVVISVVFFALLCLIIKKCQKPSTADITSPPTE